jgi:hypothetical protein
VRDMGSTGDGMTAPRWRSSLAVEGFDARAECQVPVAVGLIDTTAGGVQIALRVGDDQPVILAVQDANQLASNLNEITAERLRVTAERFRGDEP